MIDTYKKLDIGFDKIEKIVQLADVHIRLTKRHDEYREVFEKVYAYIKTTPPNTIITNLGDTLHSKVDLSPEAVQLTAEFLKNLANLRPVILIAGNHDCLLLNYTRLDSLTPIVNMVNHSKLFYLKETGLYGAGNVLFNNMSVFDDVTTYIDIKNITQKIQNQFDTKIALFHGGVHGSMTDVGYLIENKVTPREFFDGHDIVLLGDIHKSQTFYVERVITLEQAENFATSDMADDWAVIEDAELDEGVLIRKSKPIMHYVGSMLQQNHGEALLGHGLSVWDIAARTFEHVEIPNDYGYYTIDIDDGKLVTDISDMPAKPRLRVKCRESVATEVKEIVANIRKKYQISDIIYNRVDGDSGSHTKDPNSIANLTQISNVDYQNKLIKKYLEDEYPSMDKDTLEEIFAINKSINETIPKEDQSRNIRWKPVSFEFSNMFSYGEGNIIDFTKMSDVYGLFAANASGKSSIMDALCFTIFDKSARAFKAVHVMNDQKMTFKGKFTFEINGVKHVIIREGKRDKKNAVKVDVNFAKIINGKEEPLNEEQRRSTNEIIRESLGTYEDFVLTTLALQGTQGSFVDMKQTGRKEILSQFIGLNIFDNMVASANAQMKSISGAIKIFNKEDGHKKIVDMMENIWSLDKKLEELSQQKEAHSIKIKELTDIISVTEDKIIKLINVPTDVDQLIAEHNRLIGNEADTTAQQLRLSADITTTKTKLDGVIANLKENVGVDLVEKHKNYLAAISKHAKTVVEFDKLKALVKEKLKKLEHLAKHEFDPKCPYCMNNVFVKDAIATRESLEADKMSAKEFAKTIDSLSKDIQELEPFDVKYNLNKELLDSKNSVAADVARKELALNNTASVLEKIKNKIDSLKSSIELYERSKEVIEQNKQVERSLQLLNSDLQRENLALRVTTTNHVEAYSKKVSLGDQIKTIKEQISKVEEAEREHAAYEYYLSAVGRDGIPYRIISEVAPKIEQEVNNILSQIVDFGVSIETDGNNVNVLIKYENRKWPLELSSGMEKFVCALALRIALINISNLPRPNFLVVDEGFGALDADKMAMVQSLFGYLKSNFDFIIIISHLDVMRDMVNKHLEIKKENGFSKVDNST